MIRRPASPSTWLRLVDAATIPILVPLFVPVAVYAACLLAATTSLPLLRRSIHPTELRYV